MDRIFFCSKHPTHHLKAIFLYKKNIYEQIMMTGYIREHMEHGKCSVSFGAWWLLCKSVFVFFLSLSCCQISMQSCDKLELNHQTYILFADSDKKIRKLRYFLYNLMGAEFYSSHHLETMSAELSWINKHRFRWSWEIATTISAEMMCWRLNRNLKVESSGSMSLRLKGRKYWYWMRAIIDNEWK